MCRARRNEENAERKPRRNTMDQDSVPETLRDRRKKQQEANTSSRPGSTQKQNMPERDRRTEISATHTRTRPEANGVEHTPRLPQHPGGAYTSIPAFRAKGEPSSDGNNSLIETASRKYRANKEPLLTSTKWENVEAAPRRRARQLALLQAWKGRCCNTSRQRAPRTNRPEELQRHARQQGRNRYSGKKIAHGGLNSNTTHPGAGRADGNESTPA